MNRLFALLFALLSTFLLSVQAIEISMWHTRPSFETALINQFCDEFEKAYMSSKHMSPKQAPAITVTCTSINFANFKPDLVSGAYENRLPDLAIVPADFLGLHDVLKISPLKETPLPKEVSKDSFKTVSVDGNVWGIPLLQGNHLLLYYNRALVDQPLKNFEALWTQPQVKTKKDVDYIGWSYAEMYWFVPFLGAYGGWPVTESGVDLNTPAMVKALDYYAKFRKHGVIDDLCNYQCVRTKFFGNKLAYVIDGDWAFKEYQKQLGDYLGEAELPKADGRSIISMYSSHSLAFLNHSLESDKRPVLLAFANYLTSADVQRRWHEKTGQLPVHSTVLKEIIATDDKDMQISLKQLAQSKQMPITSSMTYAWQAMSRGFTRHINHDIPLEQAVDYMLISFERDIKRYETDGEDK
jgi:ABC-type glycerol-3-phosphate transport system substrate-binding protein